MENVFSNPNGKLGFGFMRLPKNEDGSIDLQETQKMVDAFMASGFTYFDTAWAYAGSEEALRKTLVEHYPRDSFTIATKNAAWVNCKTREEAIAQFESSLQKTGAGYFDCYLFHNLGDERTKVFEQFDLWSWAREQKEKGLIRKLGFSFHGTAPQLEEILSAHPETDFVQLQINYADWESPVIQSKANYETARRHGKPVVVMEPVKGGMLAAPPESVAAVFKKADEARSCASWALRFAADLEGVAVVLSGMSSLEQVEDNLHTLKGFRQLDEREKSVLAEARETMAKIRIVPCTSCNYCAKVCPKGIGISGTFTAVNYIYLYNNYGTAAAQEKWFVTDKGKLRANACIRCGLCESVCPQHIAIRDELARAFILLENGPADAK